MKTIYRITNKLNGKIYIGQTKSYAARKKWPYRSGIANGYFISRSLEEVALL